MSANSPGEFKILPMSSVVFGSGAVLRLTEKVEELNARRTLIVTSPSVNKTELVERVKKALGNKYAGTFANVVPHVPRQSLIDGVRVAKEGGADILVSVGGGSATDTAKGIRLVLAESTGTDDFFVKFDRSDAVTVPVFLSPKMPQIAIPTTLSGGEFTGSAGITDTERKCKDIFRDPKLTPRVVILDPEMTAFTPRQLWASTGMKVLADCFEEVCSPRHQTFVDALALHSIRTFDSYLVPSLAEPMDFPSRSMLQQASWMGMYGAISTGLGIIAGLRHQIGGAFGVQHGVASTIIFPHCIEFNRPLIDERLLLVAKALDLPTRNAGSAASAVVDRVKELISKIGLPARLRDVGIRWEDLQVIAEAGMQDHQTRHNPKTISSIEQLLGVLEKAW